MRTITTKILDFLPVYPKRVLVVDDEEVCRLPPKHQPGYESVHSDTPAR